MKPTPSLWGTTFWPLWCMAFVCGFFCTQTVHLHACVTSLIAVDISLGVAMHAEGLHRTLVYNYNVYST